MLDLDDRRGAVGALGADRPAPIHPDRRDHAAGADHDAACATASAFRCGSNFYSAEELEQVVRRAARLLGLTLTDDGAREIARRARGTPRVAGRLLRRVRDFAQSRGEAEVERQGRRRGADPAGGRSSSGSTRWTGATCTMIADIYKRRPGRGRDARRRPFRAARHDRGSDRALSHPAGPDRAHRARALPQRPRLDPSRPARTQGRDRPACSKTNEGGLDEEIHAGRGPGHRRAAGLRPDASGAGPRLQPGFGLASAFPAAPIPARRRCPRSSSSPTAMAR